MKREPSTEDAIKLQADVPQGVAQPFLSVKPLLGTFYSIYIVCRGRDVLEERRK